MKTAKRIILFVISGVLASFCAPALADVAAIPFYHGSVTWQLFLTIGVFCIALAALIVLIIHMRKRK